MLRRGASPRPSLPKQADKEQEGRDSESARELAQSHTEKWHPRRIRIDAQPSTNAIMDRRRAKSVQGDAHTRGKDEGKAFVTHGFSSTLLTHR
jgi:hypothetical protein